MFQQLWERSRDWVLLAICLIFSVYLFFYRNDPIVRALRSGALQITGFVESRFSGVGTYMRALDENERLRQNNIELSAALARAREAQMDNDRLRSMLAFRDTVAYPLLPVRIMTKDYGGMENFFTIAAGSRQGVQDGMAIVDDRGILGRVVLVGETYSRVMSYLHIDFAVPSRITELGTEGITRWSGSRNDRLSLEQIVRTSGVEAGMSVVTSPLSSYFPPGLPIGTVRAVDAREGQNELVIDVEPAAPLERATFAFVVMNIPDPALRELEQRVP